MAVSKREIEVELAELSRILGDMDTPHDEKVAILRLYRYIRSIRRVGKKTAYEIIVKTIAMVAE